jgi:hypothetical protein
LSGDGGFKARCGMRVQERAKLREGKLLNVLDQQRRVGEARTGASHDGGEVAAGRARAEAGQRGARGRRPEERS